MSKSNILLCQIAPQRSTQYTTLATDLAPAELMLSTAGNRINSIEPLTLGGQPYLRVELNSPITEAEQYNLGMLAMTSGFFRLYDRLGDVDGPLLSPLETGFVPHQPVELITSRRYRGKTNELFTQWLCNVAKFSSAFAEAPWSDITLVDPLSGGGTTSFVALVLGAHVAAGVEQDPQNGKSTASYLKQFAQEKQISARLHEERLKKLGQRWTISLERAVHSQAIHSLADKKQTKAQRDAQRQTAIFVRGDTVNSRQLLPGLKPHLVVTDLPYGVQHQGKLTALLEEALPVWSTMLRKGGSLAMSWDSTRLSAEILTQVVEANSDLKVRCEEPYNQFSHRVDRVIKERNVLVAQR